jgi:hypothetical protein
MITMEPDETVIVAKKAAFVHGLAEPLRRGRDLGIPEVIGVNTVFMPLSMT